MCFQAYHANLGCGCCVGLFVTTVCVCVCVCGWVCSWDREDSLAKAVMDVNEGVERTLAGGLASIQQGVTQQLAKAATATAAAATASADSLRAEFKGAVEEESKARREAVGTLHAQVVAANKANRDVVGSLQSQLTKLTTKNKTLSKQTTQALADMAATGKRVQTLSEHVRACVGARACLSPPCLSDAHLAVGRHQMDARLDKIHRHQADLRAKAHQRTLDEAFKRVDAMRSSITDAVRGEQASSQALADAQAEEQRAKATQQVDSIAKQLKAAKAELLARMDAQYQDVRTQALEAGALSSVILKEQAAREEDTRVTRAQLSELDVALKAAAAAAAKAQARADEANTASQQNGASVAERSAGLAKQVEDLQAKHTQMAEQLQTQVLGCAQGRTATTASSLPRATLSRTGRSNVRSGRAAGTHAHCSGEGRHPGGGVGAKCCRQRAGT